VDGRTAAVTPIERGQAAGIEAPDEGGHGVPRSPPGLLRGDVQRRSRGDRQEGFGMGHTIRTLARRSAHAFELGPLLR
jgi:hypothetical protein